MLQLQRAARGLQVLAGGDARHGGLVHADRVGHFLQGQRRHRFFAAGEEAGLAFDDHPGGAQQGVIAHGQPAGQPACFLQHVAQRLGRIAGIGQRVFVTGIDAQAAAGGRVERHAPLVVGVPGDHIGDDHAVVVRAQAVARARLQ
ncbi:hypothetical protein D3C71_1306390 [compost metagenome]